MIAAAWRYRHFIVSAIAADIRARFANSRFAAFWLVVQPLLQVAIFATILSSVLSARLPGSSNRYAYAVYLLAGVGAWSLFQELLTRSVSAFVEAGPLLKKIAFPRVCIPLIVAGGALLNFALFLLIATIFLLAIGAFPGLAMLWLIPLTVLVCALAGGFGVLLGVMNVFMRDIGQAIAVLLNIAFWLTPIVYPASIVPAGLQSWLALNPMAPVIIAFQDVFLLGRMPDWFSLAPAAAMAACGLVLAAVVFERAGPEMVDVL